MWTRRCKERHVDATAARHLTADDACEWAKSVSSDHGSHVTSMPSQANATHRPEVGQASAQYPKEYQSERSDAYEATGNCDPLPPRHTSTMSSTDADVTFSMEQGGSMLSHRASCAASSNMITYQKAASSPNFDPAAVENHSDNSQFSVDHSHNTNSSEAFASDTIGGATQEVSRRSGACKQSACTLSTTLIAPGATTMTAHNKGLVPTAPTSGMSTSKLLFETSSTDVSSAHRELNENGFGPKAMVVADDAGKAQDHFALASLADSCERQISWSQHLDECEGLLKKLEIESNAPVAYQRIDVGARNARSSDCSGQATSDNLRATSTEQAKARAPWWVLFMSDPLAQPSWCRFADAEGISLQKPKLELPHTVDIDFTKLISTVSNHGRASEPARECSQGQGRAKTDAKSECDSDGYDSDESQNPRQASRLDLSMLVDLLESAEATVQYVRDKDVVLLLGFTGAGKSTLIQALDGKLLRQEPYKFDQEGSAEKYVWVAEHELEGFSIGHDQESKTKGINHYAKSDVVYVDSSGFEDTAGAEVDISTTLAFMRVAKSCRSLRFVVLVDCAAFQPHRGGEIRSAVKLARNFVDEFKRYKYAFSFLFTHTDKLEGAPGKELEEVKRVLRGRLAEVLKGTRDDKSVKIVLKGMMTCLDNNEPFVDVFHPGLSDIAELRRGFEKFEPLPHAVEDGKPIYSAIGIDEPPGDVICCGLTAKSISKIKNELDRLRMEIRILLDKQAFQELAKVSRTLDVLRKHMPEIEEVAVAFEQLELFFQDRRQALTDKAWELCKVGTADGPQNFHSDDARRALEQLASLDALEKFHVAEATMRTDSPRGSIARAAESYVRDSLKARVSREFGDFFNPQCPLPPLTSTAHALQIMSAWAEAHQAFAPLEQVLRQMLELYIESCTRSFGDWRSCGVASAVQRLAHLHHICKSLPSLAQNGIDAVNAASLRNDLSYQVTRALDDGVETALSAVKFNFDAPKFDREKFHEAMKVVEGILESLDDDTSVPELKAHSERAWNAVLTEVVVEIKRIRLALSSSSDLHTAAAAERLALLMNTMSARLKAASGAGASYQKILDEAVQTYECLSGKLRQLPVDVLDGEVGHMNELVSVVKRLYAIVWIDGHLKSDQGTVAETLSKHQQQCCACFMTACRDAFLAFRSVLDVAEHVRPGAGGPKIVHRYLHRIRNLEQLGNVYPVLAKSTRCFDEACIRMAQSWRDEQVAIVNAYPDTLQEFEGKGAQHVNSLLSLCEEMRKISYFHGPLETVCDMTRAKMDCIRRGLESLLVEGGHYDQKAIVLRTLKSWHTSKLEFIAKTLPGYEDTRIQLQSQLAENARRTQAMMADASVSDCESMLQDLEGALPLDSVWDSQTAHNAVHFLRSLLELKTCTLMTDEIARQINEGKFKDTRKQIQTLKCRGVDHNQLQAVWTAIQSRVTSHVAKAEASVTNGEQVASELGRLGEFNKEFGNALELKLEERIADSIKRIEVLVNGTFEGMIKDLEDAAKAGDFTGIIHRQRAAILYFRHTGSCISNSRRQRFRSLCERSGEVLKPVEDAVGKFVSQLPKVVSGSCPKLDGPYAMLGILHRMVADAESGNDNNSDVISCPLVVSGHQDDSSSRHSAEELTWSSSMIATGLSVVTSVTSVFSKGPSDYGKRTKHELLKMTLTVDHVRTCYVRLQRDLDTCLDSVVDDMREMEKKECYMTLLKALQLLVREMDLGLAAHVHSRRGADAWLERIQQVAEKTTEEHRHWLQSTDQAKFASMLAKLNSIPQKPWATHEHKAKVDLLKEETSRCLRDAIAGLDGQDFDLASCSASILVLVKKDLQESTLGQSFRKEFQEVQSRVEKSFAQQHIDLKGAMDGDNMASFEMLLWRYHKFVKAFSRPFPHLDPQPLHEYLFNYTEKKVQRAESHVHQFDFADAEKEIVLLRELGRILTGIFAVYRESGLKQDDHLNQMTALCSKHFHGKDLADLGKHYAVLEVSPEACEEDIKKAFKRKSQEYHPDTHNRKGILHPRPSEMQQKITNARDTLLENGARERYQRALREPFAELAKSVPGRLKSAVEHAFRTNNYEQIRAVLAAMKQLHALTVFERATAVSMVSIVLKERVDQLSADVKKHWNNRKLKDLNDVMMTLEDIHGCVSAFPDVYDSRWRDIKDEVERELDLIAHRARVLLKSDDFQEHPQDFALQIIFLGRIFDDLPKFRDHATLKISDLLDECQERGEITTLFKLGMIFEQGKVGEHKEGQVIESDQRIGKVIVNEFRHFKDVLTCIWNTQTDATQKSIEATLKDIDTKQVIGSRKSSSPVAKEKLKQGFDEYTNEFNRLFHAWRAGECTRTDKMVNDIVKLASKLQPCRVDSWSTDVKRALPALLAGVAAYFTIKKSGDSYQKLLKGGRGHGQKLKIDGDCKSFETEHVLKKPHNTQILTILRLFGYDDNSSGSLRSQLMHIRTGEGKSMILGMCSLILGLLGFRVRCICYSEYLSLRDYKLFEDMFKAFKLSDVITYSKITTFSENQIAAKGDIRDLTCKLFLARSASGGPALARIHSSPETASNSKASALPQQSASLAGGGHGWTTVGPSLQQADVLRDARSVPPEACAVSKDLTVPEPTCREILLVDEVDMFFGKNFYGETHNQTALLEDDDVSAILRQIWAVGTSGRSHAEIHQHIQHSSHYRDLLRKFSGLKDIIESEVESMCHDVHDFQNPEYEVCLTTGRIGYKVMDGISYDVVYGYRTAFAHLNEERKSQSLANAVPGALRLRVPCGQFSYANIRFDVILGVSGTVDSLGESEWKIMNDYGIDLYTIMPSVYGPSNFRFMELQDPIRITNTEDEHFMAITDEVNTVVAGKRAVIVIFEDSSTLERYRKSEYPGPIQRKNWLTEKLGNEEKEFIIKKAATSGTATFTSAIFGRGTDFFCNDEKLQTAGGVHVIQAFFSIDKSEEVQIQGRTARQGQKGTYSMVLLKGRVEESMGIATVSNMPAGDLYRTLEDQRNKKQDDNYEEITKRLRNAQERDSLTHQYFDALLSGSVQATDLFRELYKKLKLTGCGTEARHIVFCLDESGSMNGQPWVDLMAAFRSFIQACHEQGNVNDLVSVVQFSSSARVTITKEKVSGALARSQLTSLGGGTCFRAPLEKAHDQFAGETNLQPVLVFMSDGQNDDGNCEDLLVTMCHAFPCLQCHMIFFGRGAGASRLQAMAAAVPNSQGKFHLSVDATELTTTFKSIAVAPEFKASSE